MSRKKKPVNHGTPAGYQQELRRGVDTCRRCRKAWREYHREYRRNRSQT